MAEKKPRSPPGGLDLLGGLLVGVIATYGMTVFQSRYGKAIREAFSSKKDEQKQKAEEESSASSEKREKREKSEPSTVKVANRIYRAIAREEIPEAKKSAAGQMVHYGFGTSLGLAYTLFAHSNMQSGLKTGLLFGAAVWMFADEIMLWALGVSKAPAKYPKPSHVYALVSHLVFGALVGIGAKVVQELASREARLAA